MPQSLATFDAALKDDYGPGLKKSINEKATVVIPQLTKNTEDIQGRQAVWSVHSGRSGSTGGRREGASLPRAMGEKFTGPREDLAYLYHTIKVTGQAAELTKGNDAAFAQALETEMKGAKANMTNDVARQIANGRKIDISGVLYSGVLGTITGVAGNVLTFANLTDGEFRTFFIGMILDAMDPTTAGTVTMDGSVGGDFPKGEILGINRVNKEVTVRDATGAGTGDHAVRQGSWDAELNGLQYLLDPDLPFAGIDPAVTPSWAPVEVNAGSPEGIGEDFLMRMHEAIEVEGDGNSGELFLTSYRQERELANQLRLLRRYDGRETTLKAGWKALDVADGVLAKDKYIADDRIYLLTLSEIEWFVGRDFDFDDLDGKVLYKALDDSDAVQARYKAYVQLVTTNRNSHAVGELTVPAT